MYTPQNGIYNPQRQSPYSTSFPLRYLQDPLMPTSSLASFNIPQIKKNDDINQLQLVAKQVINRSINPAWFENDSAQNKSKIINVLQMALCYNDYSLNYRNETLEQLNQQIQKEQQNIQRKKKEVRTCKQKCYELRHQENIKRQAVKQYRNYLEKLHKCMKCNKYVKNISSHKARHQKQQRQIKTDSDNMKNIDSLMKIENQNRQMLQKLMEQNSLLQNQLLEQQKQTSKRQGSINNSSESLLNKISNQMTELKGKVNEIQQQVVKFPEISDMIDQKLKPVVSKIQETQETLINLPKSQPPSPLSEIKLQIPQPEPPKLLTYTKMNKNKIHSQINYNSESSYSGISQSNTQNLVKRQFKQDSNFLIQPTKIHVSNNQVDPPSNGVSQSDNQQQQPQTNQHLLQVLGLGLQQIPQKIETGRKSSKIKKQENEQKPILEKITQIFQSKDSAGSSGLSPVTSRNELQQTEDKKSIIQSKKQQPIIKIEENHDKQQQYDSQFEDEYNDDAFEKYEQDQKQLNQFKQIPVNKQISNNSLVDIPNTLLNPTKQEHIELQLTDPVKQSIDLTFRSRAQSYIHGEPERSSNEMDEIGIKKQEQVNSMDMNQIHKIQPPQNSNYVQTNLRNTMDNILQESQKKQEQPYGVNTVISPRIDEVHADQQLSLENIESSLNKNNIVYNFQQQISKQYENIFKSPYSQLNNLSTQALKQKVKMLDLVIRGQNKKIDSARSIQKSPQKVNNKLGIPPPLPKRQNSFQSSPLKQQIGLLQSIQKASSNLRGFNSKQKYVLSSGEVIKNQIKNYEDDSIQNASISNLKQIRHVDGQSQDF